MVKCHTKGRVIEVPRLDRGKSEHGIENQVIVSHTKGRTIEVPKVLTTNGSKLRHGIDKKSESG